MDEMKVQHEEAKQGIQLLLDFLKENSVEEFDIANSTLLKNELPKTPKSISTVRNIHIIPKK